MHEDYGDEQEYGEHHYTYGSNIEPLNITEDHLNLALETYAALEDPTKEKLDPHIERILFECESAIIRYIIKEFAKEGRPSFTDDDIHSRFSELVTNKTIENMVKDGILEEDLDDYGEKFRLTDLGKKLAKEIDKDTWKELGNKD